MSLEDQIEALNPADYKWDTLMAKTEDELKFILAMLTPTREKAMNLYYAIDHMHRQVSQALGVKEYRRRKEAANGGNPGAVLREMLSKLSPEEIERLRQEYEIKAKENAKI